MQDSLICDMHVHTHFSCDSDEIIENYCLAAAPKGVYALCFTEHVDFNENDDGCGYYNADAFFDEFTKMKEQYKNSVRLLSGLEFSEMHLYSEKSPAFELFPYDFIMCSIHYWYQDMFPSRMVKEGIAIETCYEYYWAEVLKAVKHGNFDCLGHIDFPKRYYKKSVVTQKTLREICGIMIANDICLEINTSSLRKGLAESMPDHDILAIYSALGGKHVTIGSDAHTSADLSMDYLHAKRLIEHYNLQEVIFKNRKKCILSDERNFRASPL